MLLQHPDIVRIEGLENLTGLVNHVRYVDTTRGLTNMMEAGLAQLNQTLLIDRHAELIALIHNAAHFENQARIINFGPIAMQGARIN